MKRFRGMLAVMLLTAAVALLGGCGGGSDKVTVRLADFLPLQQGNSWTFQTSTLVPSSASSDSAVAGSRTLSVAGTETINGVEAVKLMEEDGSYSLWTLDGRGLTLYKVSLSFPNGGTAEVVFDPPVNLSPSDPEMGSRVSVRSTPQITITGDVRLSVGGTTTSQTVRSKADTQDLQVMLDMKFVELKDSDVSLSLGFSGRTLSTEFSMVPRLSFLYDVTADGKTETFAKPIPFFNRWKFGEGVGWLEKEEDFDAPQVGPGVEGLETATAIRVLIGDMELPEPLPPTPEPTPQPTPQPEENIVASPLSFGDLEFHYDQSACTDPSVQYYNLADYSIQYSGNWDVSIGAVSPDTTVPDFLDLSTTFGTGSGTGQIRIDCTKVYPLSLWNGSLIITGTHGGDPNSGYGSQPAPNSPLIIPLRLSTF